MVGIAISVAIGMLMASVQVLPSALFFFFAAASLVTALLWRRHRTASAWVFVTIAFTAACRFLVAQPDLAPDSINHSGLKDGQLLCLEGRVSHLPEYHAKAAQSFGLWTFPVEVQCVAFSNEWKTFSGKLDIKLISSPEKFDLGLGDLIEVRGRIQHNRFPWQHKYVLIVREPHCKKLKTAGFTSPLQWGRAWRNAAAPRLEVGLENLPLQAAVLKALVLGYRDEIPQEVVKAFRRTGAMHIFAISGLHVGIVAFLLALALKSLGVPRTAFGLLLIPLLALYVISTGMKASAIRALLMAAVFILAPLFRRRPDIPNSIAIAALLLLIFQPMEIRSAGFIFSFTVVIFLVMVFSSVPKHWIQGPWFKVYTTSLVISTIAAGLASVPLTALLFGRFSPIAFVGNMVVVPLTFCIVVCGWLSILIPWVGPVFNSAAVVFIDLMVAGVQWLDRLPGSSWPVDSPSLTSVLLWYVSLIALFTICRNRRQRFSAIGFAVFAVVLAVVG